MKNFLINDEKLSIKMQIEQFLRANLQNEIPIIVCIGTDAVTGDSLGPLVGSMLKAKLLGKTYVFGTVDCPITAYDVAAVSQFVKNAYPDTPILAIDAALGQRHEIGKIKTSLSPIKPGLGVDKRLAEIGSLSIIGIVEEKGNRFLSSVRLSLVYNMAEIISTAIESYIKSCVTSKDRRVFQIVNK